MLFKHNLNRSHQEEQSVNLSVCADSTNACYTLFIVPQEEAVMQAFFFAQDGRSVCYISDVSWFRATNISYTALLRLLSVIHVSNLLHTFPSVSYWPVGGAK